MSILHPSSRRNTAKAVRRSTPPTPHLGTVAKSPGDVPVALSDRHPTCLARPQLASIVAISQPTHVTSPSQTGPIRSHIDCSLSLSLKKVPLSLTSSLSCQRVCLTSRFALAWSCNSLDIADLHCRRTWKRSPLGHTHEGDRAFVRG